MNERYTELEAQCWVQIPCDFDMAADGLSTIRTVFDHKKFAELLIEECCSIVMGDKVISWTDSIRISKNVKEEFGIHEYES